MPLTAQHRWDCIDVWVWKITETLDELSRFVPKDEALYARERFASEKRRAEWLAVRAIIAQQFGRLARIVYDGAGKPSVVGVAGCISISHTNGYAVVAFSRECEVGLDAELASRDVLPVAGRFLSLASLDALPPAKRNRVALVNWCAKEALFKITGNLGGNFKDNISVADFEVSERGCVALSLVGVDYDGELLYVADYSFNDDLLLVLCRKQSDVERSRLAGVCG